jgi:hypothetical protein
MNSWLSSMKGQAIRCDQAALFSLNQTCVPPDLNL